GAFDGLARAESGAPAEFVSRAVDHRDDCVGVSGAAGGDLGLDVNPADVEHDVDDLAHAGSDSGTDVVDAMPGTKVVEGGEVGFGEVYHVNVVADAGAVGGVV